MGSCASVQSKEDEVYTLSNRIKIIKYLPPDSPVSLLAWKGHRAKNELLEFYFQVLEMSPWRPSLVPC